MCLPEAVKAINYFNKKTDEAQYRQNSLRVCLHLKKYLDISDHSILIQLQLKGV